MNVRPLILSPGPARGCRQPEGLPRAPEDHFFLLATRRSGSTWLQQTLNAHKEVTCLFEPSRTLLQRAFLWLDSGVTSQSERSLVNDLKSYGLARLPLRFHYRMERLEKDLARATTRLTGAKLVFPDLFTNIDFTQLAIRFRKARFILLDRSSAVDALCSLTLAERMGVWHSETRSHADVKSFMIGPDYAREYIMRNLLYRNLAGNLLRNLDIRFVEITYEQLMGEPPHTLAVLAQFLGVNEVNDRSRLRKRVVRPYREFVVNYDELVEIERAARQPLHGVTGTRYAPAP